MRVAECWNDHRLVRSLLRLRILPPIKKSKQKKSINRIAIDDPVKLSLLRQEIVFRLDDIPEPPPVASTSALTAYWGQFSAAPLEAAKAALRQNERRHQN